MTDSDVFPSFDWKPAKDFDKLKSVLLNGATAVEIPEKFGPSALGVDGVKDLIKSLNTENNLLALRIRGNEVAEEGAIKLSNMLLEKYSLQHFGLSNNMLTMAAAESFANMLRVNKSLVCLSLTECGLNDDRIVSIAQQLEYTNRSLIQLDLSNNNICDPGAQVLAKVFTQNYILTSMRLRNNIITEKGAKAFVDSLENGNFAITTLDLSGNDVGECGADIERLIGANLHDQRMAFFEASDYAVEAPLRTTKINIVGQDKSGKSALLTRLFDENVNNDYAPSFGISRIPVQARIDGSPWRKHGLKPLNGFCPEFLARFANIRLDKNLDAAEKNAIEQQKKEGKQNRRMSIQNLRRGSTNGAEASQRRRSAERRGSADPVNRTKRPSSVGGLTNPFKRKMNDKFDESDFIFYDEKEDEQYDPSSITGVYSESEKPEFFHPEVMAKARRERDNIGFNIFEFSGKRMYYPLFHSFLTESGIYLITFNLEKLLVSEDETDANKVEEFRDCQRYLNYWLKTIKYNSPGASIVLVGTRLDEVVASKDSTASKLNLSNVKEPGIKALLKHAEKVLDGLLQGVFQELVDNKEVQAAFQAQKLASSLTGASVKEIKLVKNFKDKINFFPVSRNGDGVGKLRVILDEIAGDQKYFSEAIPPRYLKFLDWMMKTNKPWIDEATVKKCADETLGELAGVEMPKALKFLKGNGTIMQMENLKSKFKNSVVLDPMWLAENATKIFMDHRNMAYDMDKMKVNQTHNYSKRDYTGEEVYELYKEVTDTCIIKREFLEFIWDAENITFLTKFLEQNLIICRWAFGENSKDKKNFKYMIPGSLRPSKNIAKKTAVFNNNESPLVVGFDFNKNLTLGVFERLVCQILQSTVASAPDSKEPELLFGFSRHYWGDEFQFVLWRRPDTINCLIEKSKPAPVKCINRLEKMLGKVQELLGEGLEYKTVAPDPDSGKRVLFKDVSKHEVWHQPL